MSIDAWKGGNEFITCYFMLRKITNASQFFVGVRTRLLPSGNIELCRSILNSAVRIALAPRNASQRQNRDSETWALGGGGGGGGGGCYTGAWECEQAREINKELAQKRPDQCRSSFKFACFNFARKLLFVFYFQ